MGCFFLFYLLFPFYRQSEQKVRELMRQQRHWRRQWRRQRGVGGDVGEIAGFRSWPESVRPQGPHKNGRHGVRAEPQRPRRQVRMFTGRRRDFRGKSSAKYT